MAAPQNRGQPRRHERSRCHASYRLHHLTDTDKREHRTGSMHCVLERVEHPSKRRRTKNAPPEVKPILDPSLDLDQWQLRECREDGIPSSETIGVRCVVSRRFVMCPDQRLRPFRVQRQLLGQCRNAKAGACRDGSAKIVRCRSRESVGLHLSVQRVHGASHDASSAARVLYPETCHSQIEVALWTTISPRMPSLGDYRQRRRALRESLGGVTRAARSARRPAQVHA